MKGCAVSGLFPNTLGARMAEDNVPVKITRKKRGAGKIGLDKSSNLFCHVAKSAVSAGLLPEKSSGAYDGNALMKWYAVFTQALIETAQADDWPVTFQISR